MSAFLLALVLTAAPPAAPADTVVVCPEAFRAALEPWLAYRRGQGHTIELVSNTLSEAGIRAEIRRVATGGKLRFVVLVGDSDMTMFNDAQARRRGVPTHWAQAKINTHWGSTPYLATDNWYADLDDDGKPDVAIGRLTPDTPEELTVMVRKILAYEQGADFGPWRTRVNFVAGVGGFGALADGVIEMGAKSIISDLIPASYSTTMTYASWRSPYCPDPSAFRRITLDRLNEGCWLWCYIGHGLPNTVDSVRVPGREYPVLSASDAAELRCAQGAPVALFLACYTGAFDAAGDCLAEEMLRSEGGPVAVLAGSRVTMPYAMAVMSSELMGECFTRRAPTIGEAMLGAKRRMMDADSGNFLLSAIAKAISPVPADLAGERAEHVQLFNILGDPLLRLRYPQEVKLNVPATARPGERLTITGDCPIEGPCTVELVVRRDRLRFESPARQQFDASPEALAQYQETYARANDPCWCSSPAQSAAGRFQAELEVPADASGPCHVRVFIRGASDFASGAADVLIAPAETAR